MSDGSAPHNGQGHDVLALAIGAGALVLLTLSPWLVDTSGPEPFYKGPLIFPLIALSVTICGALPAAWRHLVRGQPLSLHVDGRGFPARAALLFLLMCLFPPAIAGVGLDIASFLLIFAGLVLVHRRPLRSLLIAVGLAIVIHLAFRTFLDIWFPQPWLAGMIGG